MNQDKWSPRIIIRYTLIQLPGIVLFLLIMMALRKWIGMPVWLIWAGSVLWIAKDIILFPLLWRAYAQDSSKGINPLIGKQGITKERLDPSGYINVEGELWLAEITECSPPIETGKRVLIRDICGLKLTVEQDHDKT